MRKPRREQTVFKSQENTENDTEILLWKTNQSKYIQPLHILLEVVQHILLDLLQRENIFSKAATHYCANGSRQVQPQCY